MLAYLYIAIAIAVRVVSGTGTLATLGFTPLGASLLFFGSRMPRKHFALATCAMIACDVYLNRFVYQIPLGKDQYVIWLWYVGACFLGSLLKDRVKPLNVGFAALGASVSFFLISNFAVWIFWPMYPKTLAGLGAAYVAAIPFFEKGIVSDLVFSAIFFSIPVLIAQAKQAAANNQKTA